MTINGRHRRERDGCEHGRVLRPREAHQSSGRRESADQLGGPIVGDTPAKV